MKGRRDEFTLTVSASRSGRMRLKAPTQMETFISQRVAHATRVCADGWERFVMICEA